MKNQRTSNKEAEVLFQKLGPVWYAFTEIDNELVYSCLPEGINPLETKLELFEIVEEHLQKVSRIQKGQSLSAA